MTPVRIARDLPHLFSGLIAASLAAAALCGAAIVAVHLERRTVVATAPELFQLKKQGLAFQRAAARAPNVLPLYGSSELTANPVPERASIFFRTAPTGFQVSPVGAGGANSLSMLQKVAALGSDLRGKKLAISLSPGWFLKPTARWWDGYKGNFSLMAASEMAFGTALDFDLKRDIASRMLKCRSTLEKSPLLEFALKRLASGRWFDRAVFCALWPLGEARTIVMEFQDHFAAYQYIRHKVKPTSPCHPEVIDWSKRIAQAAATKTGDGDKFREPSGLNRQAKVGWRDGAFRDRMEESAGWIDLELLLRTLGRIHARPLLLSMPIPGDLYDRKGVSRSVREEYYLRLRTLVQQYHFPLVEFKAHDEDSAFLYHQQSHLTAKGWIYYDRALDDFFHGRVPGS